jgi:DNA-binding response OmpR family regulator
MSKRILLVEDDPNLGFVIQDNISQKGYDVTLCKDGMAGEDAFQSSLFHLCIFDVMLPKMDGISLAKRVREKDKNIPILFLTAKSMVEDKLDGFHAGADDYITKPFSMEELLCRIEVFLKRSSGSTVASDATFKLGRYDFDCANLIIKIDDIEKTLTQKEAEILKMLFLNRDRVLKREEMLGHVWGDDDYFMGRSMDVFISRLRKYLKDDPAVQIVNYHGVGFRLEIR